MTLTVFLRTLSSGERRSVRQRFALLSRRPSLTRQFVLNLWSESRLDATAWQDIVQALLGAAATPASLKAAVTQAFRKHILRGGAIPSPWTARYGRAVTREFFCQFLKKKWRGITSLGQAQRLVTKLMIESVDATPLWLRRKYLGRYLMWATFNQENPSGDPFAGLPADADGIRARLGLDQNEEGMDLLLFIYSLPDNVEPLFPTVADAYAGKDWPWFFRPALPGEPCGLTMTWNKGESPCPEIVHKPVTFARLEEIGIAEGR